MYRKTVMSTVCVLVSILMLFFSTNATACELGACRMTGGNVTVSGDYVVGTYAESFYRLKVNRKMTDVWYTVGGQVGAPAAGCCYGPECAFGEWTHTQHAGLEGSFTFHAGTNSAPADAYIACITCGDPGWCVQARCAPFKQIFWEGIGVFKNAQFTSLSGCVVNSYPGQSYTLHYFKAHVADFGEPGKDGKQQLPGACTWTSGGVDLGAINYIQAVPDRKFGDRGGYTCQACPDYYEIEIHCTADPVSNVIYTGSGFITGGNLQIHPEVGQQCPF